MRSLANRLCRQWTLPLTFVLAIAAATLPDAGAQGRASTATGPSNGTLGGGANGASNRGGAGGVSNPSPGAGAGSAINGGGASGRTPQATESSRQGYLGGRTTPVVTPPPETPPSTSTTVPVAPLTVLSVSQFGKCAHSATLASPQARLSGNNLARIDALADGLMPGTRQGAQTARYLLADMQAELEKPDPDPLLAGTYLGMISVRPVTADLVSVVSESLCAPPLPPSRARAIAAIAEAQRLKRLSQSGTPDGTPKQ